MLFTMREEKIEQHTNGGGGKEIKTEESFLMIMSKLTVL